jgi:hypothetical protein
MLLALPKLWREKHFRFGLLSAKFGIQEEIFGVRPLFVVIPCYGFL